MDLQDWAARYRANDTPWDCDGPHPELAARLAADRLRLRQLGHGARALVPGCGKGHDALALAEAGWMVIAVDLVRDLKEEVSARLEPHGGRFLVRDALELVIEPRFELFFEHTFFCALPPERRADYGALARRMLMFRGRLVGVVFPADKPLENGGPPWRTTLQALHEAIGLDDFRVKKHEVVQHGIGRREWREEWVEFERLDTAPDGAEDSD